VLEKILYGTYLVLLATAVTTAIFFGMTEKHVLAQSQGDARIATTTKYVNGHNYIIFTTFNGLSAVHDEACFNSKHSR